MDQFINAATGQDEMQVGHDLNSCTAQLKHIVLPLTCFASFPALRHRRVILLDTPGFDDTFIDDVEIMRRIAVWLSLSWVLV